MGLWGIRNKCFVMVNDINLSGYTGTEFNIIGNDSNAFTGVFDGNGHTISNFTYTSTGRDCIGVFGCVDGGGEITNLGIVDANIDAGSGSKVGGLVGENSWGIITSCYATGVVNGSWYVGGLVGAIDEGSITNCYAMGAVDGTDFVGGLVGFNNGSITSCYTTGAVTGDTHVGGLVGDNSFGNVINSFWDIETGGPDNGIGTGLPNAQMKTQSTFTDAGWDFWPDGIDNVWVMWGDGLDYPRHLWSEFAEHPYAGSGTQADPYRISTHQQLNIIGTKVADLDKYFILINDIDLESYPGTEFNIIGNSTNNFTGVFDGNGHTISNFSYTSTGRDYIGVFGYVGSDGEITDLGIVDANIDAASGNYVGTLVGENDGGDITSCYATGAVNGDVDVGGLVGRNGWGDITSCYATGDVEGIYYVGGLVGVNGGIITSCYATGAVTGTSRVGGLVGYDTAGSYTSCFWDKDVNPGLTGVGDITDPPDVMGRTTVQMQTESTFTDYGWDFVGETANGPNDIWKILEGRDYPRLWWQYEYEAKTIFVDCDAEGANNGASWTDAYNYFADALVDANSDIHVLEIRVANGTYYPDANTAEPNGSGDREATFGLINSVAIYGGYAGAGAPDPNACDIELYETILSGDLDG
ncbi:MAG: GLUG motif-containing protein, partial [Planctomycetota bacterium]